jgi:hypothetical protein
LRAEDLDYHVVRVMVITFFFGYRKWFPYEFERLVPFISNGPLIWWLYPVFGHAGASYFLGVSEWTFGSLLADFWDTWLGVLAALGSSGTFIATVTIIPFMPEGCDVAAGGFPTMNRERAPPDEVRRTLGRIAVSAQAGRSPCRSTTRRTCRGTIAGGERKDSIEIDSYAYLGHLDRRDAARNSCQLPAERRS